MTNWTVNFTKKAKKQSDKIPKRERNILIALTQDLQINGAVLPDWSNYSKLGRNRYHCHLSYKWVACWTVEDKAIKLIKIYYVGSRKNAPY